MQRAKFGEEQEISRFPAVVPFSWKFFVFTNPEILQALVHFFSVRFVRSLVKVNFKGYF